MFYTLAINLLAFMKTVKVFFASSIIEFEKERILIGGYIRKLNDSIRDIGQKVHLYLCEDEKNNSQSFYDRNIEHSDIFIALLGEKVGDFTYHEINVANACVEIKRKIIIFTDKKSSNQFKRTQYPNFEIQIVEKDYLKNIIETLSNAIQETVQSINDEPEIQPLNSFIANIPDGNEIEVEVVNNIIRRLRDQNHNIVINDSIDGNENAYIALLSDSIKSEEIRIKKLVNIGIVNYKFWVFARNIFSHQFKSPTVKSIQTLHDSIINNFSVYPSYYSSYSELSTDIEIKFRRYLDESETNGSGFIYIIEDHWLIRKYLTTSQKCLFINLSNIEGTNERKLRKERVILNLLNQYWINGRMDKHIDAISKLLQGDYNSFIYSLDDLEEVKRREYKQAFFDYLCDIIEQIQHKTIEHNTIWLEQEINYIIKLLKERQYDLSPNDIFKVYFMIGNTYTIFPILFKKAKEFYQKALSCIESLKDIDTSLVELSKHYILTLCMRLLDRKYQHDNEIFDLAELGLKFTNINDDYYNIAFKIIEYSSSLPCSNRTKSLEQDISQSLTPDFVYESNQNLNLAIIFFLSWVQIQYDINPNNTLIYLNLINFYIEQYNRYLKEEKKYKLLYIDLLSKKALITRDYELIQETIQEYFDISGNTQHGKFYYDILYNKGSICIKNEMLDMAIEIFEYLSEAYDGKSDKGGAFQNLALCHMAKYKEQKSLNIAEDMYKKALFFYESINDFRMCGNIWDGLSYCYILQKKYQNAENSSLKALEICEYDVPNKYSNYISSLLCQGQYNKAKLYYLQLSNKDSVRMQLEKDWAAEMKESGIDTTSFERIFI